MATNNPTALLKLSDTEQTIANPEEDIRGRKVCDTEGNELGKVDDLLIDEREHKVRLLRVEHGGILGFGATPSFIPVDAVTRITDDKVYIDQSRQRVADAPPYDPDLVDATAYYDQVYSYYGYAPFWAPGYPYPSYPIGATRRPV